MLMFNCAFDWCSLWNGIPLGTISSIIATCITNRYLSRRTRKRFELAAGEYDGYGIVDEKANPFVQMQKPQSRATVRHKKNNLLRIEVEHDNR
jgi:hypothetical protein